MENNNNELMEIKLMLKEITTYLSTPKKWLNTSEVAHYLGYSTESIKKMVKNQEFKKGVHYHKKLKRLLFDKNAIDSWVISSSPINNISTYDTDKMIEDILSSVAA